MPDIQHAIVIDAPADQLLPLVSTPEGLARWWAEDVITARDTPAVELGFFNRSTIYRLVPEHDAGGARWLCESGTEWSGTRLEFRLHRQNQQTRLEFTHAGWADRTPYFVSCNTTWGHLMFRLKDVVEHGGAPRPLFTKSGMATSSTAGY